MDYRKVKAASTTVPRNLSELDATTDNIYESLMVIAKRANQINAEVKEELNQKLQEFASYSDSLVRFLRTANRLRSPVTTNGFQNRC